jgi:hypothetical protein
LDHVKTRNAGFLDTVTGIVDCCLLECFDHIRFDVYMDVDDEHFCPPFWGVLSATLWGCRYLYQHTTLFDNVQEID